MTLRVMTAHAAGSMTLFVLDAVDKRERAEVAFKLLSEDVFRAARQIGFVCRPEFGADGRIELAGGEFRGNAAMSFGMMVAHRIGGAPQRGSSRVSIEISGVPRPIAVDVDDARGYARTEMPLPRGIWNVSVDGTRGTLVDLGGIAHLVVSGLEPDEGFFERAEESFRGVTGARAYGVIFLGRDGGSIRPLVKVRITGHLAWEESCASASLAGAVALSVGQGDGEFRCSFRQPSGTMIDTTIIRRGDAFTAAYAGGFVKLDAPIDFA